jgi:hypothetical protein
MEHRGGALGVTAKAEAGGSQLPGGKGRQLTGSRRLPQVKQTESERSFRAIIRCLPIDILEVNQ